MDYLRGVHTNSNINMVPTYYWNISRGNIKIKYNVKINRCSKNIDLKNTFRKFYGKRKK